MKRMLAMVNIYFIGIFKWMKKRALTWTLGGWNL